MSSVVVARSKSEVDREISAMRRVAVKVNRSKQSAKLFLIKHGFLTANGKQLSKRYR